MLIRITVALALMALVTAVGGWPLGFQAPLSYVAFVLLSALAVSTAWILCQSFFPATRLHDACLRVSLLTFAVIVAAGLLLGSTGLLATWAYAVLLTTTFVAAVLVGRRTRGAPVVEADRISIFHPIVWVIPPLVLFVGCYGLTHPPVAYDSLTYHLFFPARWLQDGRLSIIPTPFGDQAPAYAPSNAELFYLWLMMPFHGDLLARVGELPFYGVCGAAIYGIARACGASAAASSCAAGFFLLARPIVDQAVGADVDLIFAAMLLSAVYFGVTASQTGRRSDIILFGVSIGLCLGTKFLGVIYLPLFVGFLLARRVRHQLLWIVPGLALFAAPWYLRNWVATGSPMYPVSLTVGGFTLARGAWGRDVSAQTWAHLTDLRLLPDQIVHGAFGAAMLVAWAPFALLGLWTILRRRGWIWIGLGVALPLLMTAIYWYVAPYNHETDTRYLFGGVGLAVLLTAPAFDRHPRIAPYVLAAFGVAALALLALPADALVPARYLPLALAAAVLLVGSCKALARRWAAVTVSVAAVCAIALAASLRACPPHGCALVNVAAFERPTLFAGWDWMETHARHVNIAYSGNNVPYRLLGPHLDNGVFYVNVDRHLTWRYHDYERAARQRVDFHPPAHPNPPYFRERPNPDEWIVNLRRLGIAYVFLTRLSPLMEDNYLRDPSGFPVEAAWAEGRPEIFTRVFENEEVRIYAVR